MKQYLFLMRHAPYLTSHVQEALDQLLTTAAFDQAVSVLFLDDGVFQLKRDQNAGTLGGRDTAAVLRALSLYDIEQLFVERESLLDRGLTEIDLDLPVNLICRNDLHALLAKHDVIVSD
jgi:tRNA 2-thiouridine synthesizing protein C